MKYDSLDDLNIFHKEGIEIGDYIIVIATWYDESSNKIVLQDFFEDGKSFIPVFSGWDKFDHGVKGSEFEGRGVEISRSLLMSILHGHEILILDPGEVNARILRKSDLAS